MLTRARGLPLEPLDLEIEATNRRRGGRRRARRNQAMEIPPPPSPNQAQIIHQLQLQVEEMMREREEERIRNDPVRNTFGNINIPGPPIGTRIDANNFELKTSLIQMVEQHAFSGRPTEDPNRHLTKFMEISNTTKLNGVPDETIKLRLFPFSLSGYAKDWYDNLAPGSVTSWKDLAQHREILPLSSTLNLQAEISYFRMKDQESMFEAWERFNGLLKKCPNHGIASGHQVSIFYNGCSEFIKSQLDFGSRGSFLDLGVEECKKMLERLAHTSKGWSSGRDNSARVASTIDSDSINLLTKQMMLLNQKVDSIQMGGSPMELQPILEDVNYVHQGGNQRNFQNYRPYNGGGSYNANHPYPNSHPNLSYGNPNSAFQPPPGFSVSKGGAVNEPTTTKSSSDSTNELLKAFMERTEGYMVGSTQRIDKVETAIVEVTTRMGSLEHQMSQIAQAVGKLHQPGQFPSNTVPNPKECKAIYLRSGTSYEGPPMGENEAKEQPEEEEVVEELEVEEPEKTPTPPKSMEVKLPFPQMVQKKKLDENFLRFLDIFKRVHLNIPLVEALQQMPGYLKFLKEVVSKKKRLVDYETVSLTENCSAIIQQKMPTKLKDPGSFNISCVIGDDRQTKALCDLGASINLMPLSFFRKLKFSVLKPTTVTLQMADKSVKYPNGILENVLVRVNDFIFPVDFVVLDMKEDPNVPLILGRPFLATGKALIDVTKGELTLRHGNKTVILSMLDKMKRHEMEEIKRVEGKPFEVEECKVIHVAHEEAKDENLEKPLEEISIPKWLFELEDEHPISQSSVGKQKKEVAKLAHGAFKGDVVGEKAKPTWWKKRLNKLYLAAQAKAGPNDIIRVRMDY